ncbi:MAG: hypothetical protein P8R54_33490 [Myxococcota bacterium]|nr:hypothetical protein [Myxococcota bacterium]
MRFDDNEIQELADFFSRRFPDPLLRQRMASAAGLSDDDSGWGTLLLRAQSSGRLAHLADAAFAEAPEDENLRDVRQILTAPRRRKQTLFAVSSAVALALTLVIAFAATRSDPVAEPPVQPAAVLASADNTPPPAARVAAPKPEAVAPVVKAPEPPEAPEVREAPAALEAPAEPAGSGAEEAPAPRAVPASRASTGRCRAGEGELIGYWYAGADAPGAAGATISVPVTVNVRADYPDEHNRFNARADVQCVLLEGDRLTLTVDPIRVPGQRYWVPLYGGDLP